MRHSFRGNCQQTVNNGEGKRRTLEFSCFSRNALSCSRGCEMTLLFYSAAQIEEDKGMKERHERPRWGRDATRHSQVGRSVGRILGTRLEARDYLTIMGVFSLYGVVRSTESEGLSGGRKRPWSRWTDADGHRAHRRCSHASFSALTTPISRSRARALPSPIVASNTCTWLLVLN